MLRFQSLGSSSEQVGESVKNNFDDLPQHLPKEVVQTLIRAADVRIEPIMLSPVENGGAFRGKMAALGRGVKGAAPGEFVTGIGWGSLLA